MSRSAPITLRHACARYAHHDEVLPQSHIAAHRPGKPYPLVSVLLLVIPLCGCRAPLRAVTEGNIVVHNSPVLDYGPVAEMFLEPPAGTQCARIALLDVDGLLVNARRTGLGSLGENPISVFREQLDHVAATPGYCAVVVRINSPGGGVTASDIMWHDLQSFKARTGLPVVACLMDVGAGGAYYLALAADHVVAHPTSVVGGIGVILNLYNLEDTMMQMNILGSSVKAGNHIDVGSPVRPFDPQSREILQAVADRYHARFREMVVQQRPVAAHFDPLLFDGRIFLAQEALQAHLIDSVGYLDDAIATARYMAGSPGAGVVMLHRCSDPARSPYAVAANTPIQAGILPISIPGLERTQLPTFLYMWQPEPTYERRALGR